jgi:hypothetical protein
MPRTFLYQFFKAANQQQANYNEFFVDTEEKKKTPTCSTMKLMIRGSAPIKEIASARPR